MPGRYCSANFSTALVPSTATALHSCWPSPAQPNTTSRNIGAAALYRCTVAWRAPARDVTVRSISSSLAWVSTEMRTSSGTEPDSIRLRMKSKSVWLAAGKPTSISL